MDSRAVIAALALAACSGPRPRVDVVEIEAAPAAGYERVTLAVRNESGGHGEIELTITLRGASGRRIEETRELELDAHQRLELVVDIAAPPDTYTAAVSAVYPD